MQIFHWLVIWYTHTFFLSFQTANIPGLHADRDEASISKNSYTAVHKCFHGFLSQLCYQILNLIKLNFREDL